MKKTNLLALTVALSVLAVSCEQSNTTRTDDQRTVRNEDQRTRTNGQRTDNFTSGQRTDRGFTAQDQSENSDDRAITQRIRQEIMDSDLLSTSGKNVVIITRDRIVTLRGQVFDPRERSEILNIARQVNGVRNINNQIEVSQN